MNTTLPVPDSFESILTLVDLLRYQASCYPNKVLYSYLSNGEELAGSLTFAELDQRAMHIAANLQTLTSPGDRVLLMFQPGLNYISAFMGCLYAGLIAVPSYPVNNRRRDGDKIAGLIADCEPAVTLVNDQEQCTSHQGNPLFQQTHVLAIDNLAHNLLWEPRDINTHSLAFLQYTSGSTGTPKGVMVSHANLLNNMALIAFKGGLKVEHICVSWLPPYHDMGLIGSLLTPMYVGMQALIMEPVAFLQKPYRWLKAISDYKAYSSAAPNFAYQLCVDRITDEQMASLDLRSFEFALSGAEPIRQSTMEAFRQRFAKVGFNANSLFPAYGMAETTLMTSGAQFGKPYQTLTADKEALFDGRISIAKHGKCFVSCGYTDSKHKVSIVNPQSHLALADSEIGEIWVQGPSVAQGYWGKSNLTEEIFAAQISGQEGYWLRTGDLGFVHDGQLYISGRIKDLIIIRGRNLYPQDIENTVCVLNEYLSMDGCAAFSLDDGDEEALILVQELTRQGVRSADTNLLASTIRQEVMARFSVSVADVVFIKPMTLPRTSSGKIQHAATRIAYQKNTLAVKASVPLMLTSAPEAPEKDSLSKETFVSDQPKSLNPQTPKPNKDTVLDCIKQTLLERYPTVAHALSDDTAFVDLGVDSVGAIELTGSLNDRLGYDVSVTDIWDYPTLGEFATYVASLSTVKNTRLDSSSNTLNPPVEESAKASTEPSSIKPPIKPSTDIAVIGMTCKIPGGLGQNDIESVHALWQQLLQGTDPIGPLPTSRYEDMGLAAADNFPEGGYLQEIDQFDPAYFDLSPKDAACLDPQQRLLLQGCVRLLEDAHLTLDNIKETKTGIFIGSSTDDYAQLSLNSTNMEDAPGYVGLGTARSVMVGRLAYFLATQGPALQVDTACSSSAYAIHLACQSLLSGESSQAITGGVNIIMNRDSYAALETLQAISPTGRCRTFSDDADGYIRSEACSLVMLKRVDDAVRDGDRIYGVIKASLANHDGRSNGLTAPSGKAQQRLIEDAMRSAAISPQQIGYIETHGTGTALGDPIEVKALDRVFSANNANISKVNAGNTVKLGALKSHIGHSESAAGVMALIKTMLCLHNQQIPANLHFTKPNSHINWSELHVEPVNEAQPWPQVNATPALAGLSSFGLSGTNVHCIVGPAPVVNNTINDMAAEPNLPILKLSAKTSAAFTLQVHAARDAINAMQGQPLLLEQFIRASHTKSDHAWRTALVAKDETTLQRKLQELITPDDSVFSHVMSSSSQPVVFMFTGQGALYESIAGELYQSSTIFREHIQYCDALLKDIGKADGLDIFTEHGLCDALYAQASQAFSLLFAPQFAQVSLFTIQTGLVKVLQHYGVEATDVIGHSVGEYAAAYCAHVLSLHDGLRLLMHRGQLTYQCPAGKMLAVRLSLAEIEAAVGSLHAREIDVAAVNSAKQTVLAGSEHNICQLHELLTAQHIDAKQLDTTHAFHSHLMDSMVNDFRRIASHITYHSPQKNWHSTVLARQVHANDVNADYWCRHIVEPVKFAQTVTALQNSILSNYPDIHQLTCVELGPQPVLSALLKQQARFSVTDKTANSNYPKIVLSALPMLKKPVNGNYSDIACLSNILCLFYRQGAAIAWPRVIPQNTIPGTEGGYQFNNKRYWLTPKQPTGFIGKTLVSNETRIQQLRTLLASDTTLSEVEQSLIPQLLPKLVKALDHLEINSLELENSPERTKSPEFEEDNAAQSLTYRMLWTQQDASLLSAHHSANNTIDMYTNQWILLHGGDVRTCFKNVFKHSFSLSLSCLSQLQSQLEELAQSDLDNDRIQVVLDLSSFVDITQHTTLENCIEHSRQLLLLTQAVMSHFGQHVGYQLTLLMPNFIQGTDAFEGHVFAPVWGAIKSIVHEQPTFAKMIGCSLNDLSSSNVKSLLNVIAYNRKSSDANDEDFEFLLADDVLYCPRLRSAQPDEQVLTSVGSQAEKTTRKTTGKAYVITGGCGSLGLALAAHLVELEAKCIVLLGRRVAADLPEEVISSIAEWENKGCTIHIESVDISQEQSVAHLFERLPHLLGTSNHLQGIYHLAGSPADSELFMQANIDAWASVWQPKIMGAWWLHLYSQALQPKEFVLFSSIASLLGYAGQGAYSSANFYLDWLAGYRQQVGLPATSINWGPWQGDGMAASALVNKAMAQVGIHSLQADDALTAMTSLASFGQVAIMDIDWLCLKQQFNTRYVNGILNDVVHVALDSIHAQQSAGSPSQVGKTSETFKDRLTNTPAQAQPALLMEWLTHSLSNILEMPAADVDVNIPLINLGMDSIRSLDLKHDIQKDMGIDVPVTLFLDNISLQGLSDYLVKQLATEVTSLSNGSTPLDARIVAAPEGSPLSAAQQRLWLVDQWQRQKGLYNIHSTIRVKGEFDAERFMRAMQAVVDRHEALRTHFVDGASNDTANSSLRGPQQCVSNDFVVPMTHHYWPASDGVLVENAAITNTPAEHEQQLANFARSQAHQVFDLASGPLMHIAVLHTHKASEHVDKALVQTHEKSITYVCLTLHHIIADAWSMDVLIRDFSQAYVTQKPLPELAVQYRHYAAWQSQFLEQKLPELESYWLPQLQGAPSTELPIDLQRPEKQDLSGRCFRFSLSPVQSQQLKTLAEQQGVTLFVLLLSVFFVLLNKLTKKHDLLIGTDTANRDQAATTDLIGFFVNVLALRADLSGNPVFSDIVQRVNHMVQDSITYQDMPFHHLVNKLNVPRQSDRNPLLQILFVLQNAQSADLQLDGLDIHPMDIDEQVCRFDQSLFMKEHNGQLEGYWHYATALYSSARIADQATQFCNLLTQILENSNQSLEILTMSSDSHTDTSSPSAEARKSRKRSSFGKFKKATPKPAAPKALVEKRPYAEDSLLPLMITATNQDIDAAGWANAERESILTDLKKHGAILFRNFPLNNATDFELFASKICPTLFGDYGDLPKEKGGKKIYHSTPYPKDKRILFHNESSHMHQWPTRQLFFCVKAAAVGGATPIVDCREVYRQLDPHIRDEFENKHLRYMRNFSRNLDVSWQQFFSTEDRGEVEAICQRNGIEYQWQDNDGLRTHELRRAVIMHEDSGLKSFFNQIQLHHSAFLPSEVRESLMAITGLEGLPRHVSFGDGSPISDEVARYTYDLYERLAVRFDWQPGDVVLLDNMAVAHARDAFDGERKINVAMGEMMPQQGTILLPEPLTTA